MILQLLLDVAFLAIFIVAYKVRIVYRISFSLDELPTNSRFLMSLNIAGMLHERHKLMVLKSKKETFSGNISYII